MKLQVLLVNKNVKETQEIKAALITCGYLVIGVVSQEDGLKTVAEIQPDIAVFAQDVMINPEQCCTFMKADPKLSNIPIIVLGNTQQPEVMISVLNAGADDYLNPPVSIPELIARIKAILRRVSMRGVIEEILKCGDIELNLAKFQVRAKDKDVKLAPKEFDLLYLLMKRKNYVLSREFLLDRIWGYDYEGDTRTVDVHIRRLRRKLGTAAGKIVRTVHGRGYCVTE
ncbi:MAG: response regulator transcription factor [Elusimicrobiota bacterium]